MLEKIARKLNVKILSKDSPLEISDQLNS